MSGQQSFDFTVSPQEASSLALSVSDLNQAIKSKLENGFQSLVLKGEISNFKAHSSGHLYFSLKDSQSQISAVMFRGSAARLKFRPKDGLEVLVRGKISVYKPRGSYQVLCERMDPVGAGGLKETFEKLKLKLKSEGLFDSQHKKTLPYLPFKIAIVTSPTGAALQDMLQVLGRRHPAAEVVVVPTLTQGEKAALDIVKALDAAEKIEGVEAILLSRGGGSLEDMWCFNDEALARKIFSMNTPVISGVGHEIDFTIADFVADLRAPTPSAAAELVCKNVEEVKEKLVQAKGRLRSRLTFLVTQKKTNLHHLSKRLVDPRRKLSDKRLKVDELVLRSQRALKAKLNLRKDKVQALSLRLNAVKKTFAPKNQKLLFLKQSLHRSQDIKLQGLRKKLESSSGVLQALSPFGVLDRGYSIVTNLKTGQIVRDAHSVENAQEVKIKLFQGELVATVNKKLGEKNV